MNTKQSSKQSTTRQRGSDVTVAELTFFEKIGSTLSASGCPSMAQVAAKSDIVHSYFHDTLKRLEGRSRFNRRLVDRKLVTLTKAGEEVLAYARRVLAPYRKRPFQTGRETLRIAATNRILTTLLATHLPKFIETCKTSTDKDIDIEILEANFEQVLAWLEVGEVELAFGGMNPSSHSHPKLVHHSLRTDLRMVVIAPPKGLGMFSVKHQKEQMKVELEDLGTTNVCLIRRDHRGDFRNLPKAEHGFSRIVVDNYSSVVSVVRAGTAVGLVINYDLPNDLLKFEFSDTILSAQNFAVWRRKGIEVSETAHTLLQTVGVASKRKSPSPRKAK
jgi:DNA-binding transcriptional LysR family regulator